VLLIAHRLNNVVDADQIVVVEGGRVVETGTHHSLIAADGSYARLWHATSSGRGWRLIVGRRHRLAGGKPGDLLTVSPSLDTTQYEKADGAARGGRH
jgi:hypothetical protein